MPLSPMMRVFTLPHDPLKTSRKQKDPLLPEELTILLAIVAIGFLGDLLLPWLSHFFQHLKK